MNHTEYMKMYNQKRKEQGLCPKCGKENNTDGYYCLSCKEKRKIYQRENRIFRKRLGICPQCGKNKIYGDEKVCLDCRVYRQNYEDVHKKVLTREQKDIKNERGRIVRIERKKNGICTICGKRKPNPLRAQCAVCAEKDRIRRIKRT